MPIFIDLDLCTYTVTCTVYSNSDGLTGFGAPWEIMFQENYTVLNKGGNIPGFSTLFSFVPELQLGELEQRLP